MIAAAHSLRSTSRKTGLRVSAAYHSRNFRLPVLHSYACGTTACVKGKEMSHKSVASRVSNATSVSPIADHQFLTSVEVQDILRISKKTLFNWRKSRRIEFVQRGRLYLFRRDSIEKSLAARTVVAA